MCGLLCIELKWPVGQKESLMEAPGQAPGQAQGQALQAGKGRGGRGAARGAHGLVGSSEGCVLARGRGCRAGPGACWAARREGVSGGSSGRGGSDGGRAGIVGGGPGAAERTLLWGCRAGRGRRVVMSQEHSQGWG